MSKKIREINIAFFENALKKIGIDYHGLKSIVNNDDHEVFSFNCPFVHYHQLVSLKKRYSCFLCSISVWFSSDEFICVHFIYSKRYGAI